MRRLVLALLLVAATASTAFGQRAALVEMLKGPGAVDSLAQEIWMKVIGAKLCDIEKLLPRDDIAAIFEVLYSVDREGVTIAHEKAQMMIRGLSVSLKPGTIPCKVVAEKIEGARPTYRTLATAARDGR